MPERPLLLFPDCCGIKLRTGTLIIGYMQLVAEIIALGLLALILSSGYGAQIFSVGGKFFLVVAMISIVLAVIFSSMLLFGVYMKRPFFVLVYLIGFTVLLVLMFIIYMAGKVCALSIIIFVLDLFLSVYFMMVVRSYYYSTTDPHVDYAETPEQEDS